MKIEWGGEILNITDDNGRGTIAPTNKYKDSVTLPEHAEVVMRDIPITEKGHQAVVRIIEQTPPVHLGTRECDGLFGRTAIIFTDDTYYPPQLRRTLESLPEELGWTVDPKIIELLASCHPASVDLSSYPNSFLTEFGI